MNVPSSPRQREALHTLVAGKMLAPQSKKNSETIEAVIAYPI